MDYLLKVTVAWVAFLLLFEALYKHSGKYTTNRIYLLFSILAGLLLPLIPLHFNMPDVIATTQTLYPAALSRTAEVNALTITSGASAGATTNNRLFVLYLYGIGIAFLVFKSILEVAGIIHLIRRGPRLFVADRKVIVTGRHHAPYSFMGWIFINDPDACQPEELEYIIRHEAAHNERKHWLDLLLLQLACNALWFHPLIWRYRYLLQMQHEYEADHLAARDDIYAYGHFLLQQTLLNGVPSIAHSLHFSPIKKRIKMLTQKQRPGTWKYLLTIPALLGCTFLMAKTAATAVRMRQGNVTTYNGNTFKWREPDTLFYDKATGSAKTVKASAKNKSQVIYEMNDEPVYRNEYLKTPATYSNSEISYADYLRKEFKALRKNTPDSLTTVNVLNLVIDKKGKVVYYDLQSTRPPHKYLQNEWHPYGDQEPVLNGLMDKVIRNCPDWKPAMLDGKSVNSVIKLGGEGC